MVTTTRDLARDAQNELRNLAVDAGIDMEAERSKPGQTDMGLMVAQQKLTNDATPRANRERLRVETPSGTFDGSNTAFTLSVPVAGQNIVVIWGDISEPKTIPLEKGNANPPPAGSFFFDPSDPTNIVVGNPPEVGDALIAVFGIR